MPRACHAERDCLAALHQADARLPPLPVADPERADEIVLERINEMDDKKFTLNIGCHRGTLTSRDSTVEKYDTYEQAYQGYLNAKDSWRRFGYVVWFAEIIAPDGTKTHLESNSYYS
jgi:hypothetical protein